MAISEGKGLSGGGRQLSFGALEAEATSPVPLLLDVREVAALLGVSRGLVYELMKTGDLRHCKVHSRTKIPTASVLEFVRSSLETSAAARSPVSRGATERRTFRRPPDDQPDERCEP